MAKVPVYNQEGKSVTDIELNDAVFAVKANPTLVHQVYVALEDNRRQPWAHTKDRGDVSGGGKKPWKQKGTGRARHGSTRSPIWKGGGVTFGPLNVRNYTKKINRKMNQLAVRMCLSNKVAAQMFLVLEDMEISGKTKQMATLRQQLPGSGKTTLLLIDGNHDKMALATRNIPKVDMQRAQDVNVADLLHHQYIITTKTAVQALEKRLA